jgi:hypothetical protein
MYDRELNSINFEMDNFEENFLARPYVKKRKSEIERIEEQFEEQFETTENFRKKGKGKGLFKKVGQGIKKAAKKVGEKIKDVAKKLNPEDALFLPLIPFKAVMRKILDKKKISYGNGSIKNLMKAFYSGVVKKGKNFEEEHLVSDVVSIVKEIISFLKKNKDAADAGEATEEEAELAAEVDNASAGADDIDEEEMLAEFNVGREKVQVIAGEQQVKNASASMGGLSTNTIMILVVAVVALYFVSKKS